MAREKELRNFFGNVVSTLRETDAVVAQRASTASDSSHRWHATRWQVTRTCQLKQCYDALHVIKGLQSAPASLLCVTITLMGQQRPLGSSAHFCWCCHDSTNGAYTILGLSRSSTADLHRQCVPTKQSMHDALKAERLAARRQRSRS